MTALTGSPPAGGTPPEQRGRTELRERAVERLVVAAAGSVPEVGGPATRVLGQTVGSADPESRPSADVTVAGDLVTADVRVSVRWPAPVAEVADAVRSRVEESLGRLADLRVGHVDVHVTALPAGTRPRPRVA